MREIPLTRGLIAIVDDEDFDRANAFKWCAVQARSGKFYAHRRRSDDNRYVSMHAFIMQSEQGEFIDHRESSQTLDNRRQNLRRCTHQQNGWNRSADRKSKTGFKGIHYFAPTRKWQSHIRVNDKKIHLGYFPTAEEAAKGYDAAAVRHFGEFARTNFPTNATANATFERS